MGERLASVRSPSGTSSPSLCEADRLGAALAYVSACSLLVGGDPADRYPVVAGKDPIVDPHRRNGESLAWTKGVGRHPVDGGGGIDEDGVIVTALLAPVYDPERLVDGERLRIEYLFVRPEVEAASGTATG